MANLLERQSAAKLFMAGVAGMVLTMILYLMMPVTPAWPLFLSGFIGGLVGGIVYVTWLGAKIANLFLSKRVADPHVGLPWQVNKLFLFNTLHNVAALTVIDADKARNVIEMMAAYVRTVNDLFSQSLTLLTQEVRCAELLLAIEQERLGDRLQVRTEIDADCLEVPVPGLILQPIVEHAVLHGVEMSPEPVEIVLSAHRQAHTLVLEVQDNANITYDEDKQNQALVNLGFPDLGRLLRSHFKNRTSIEVIRVQPHGTCVRISMPIA